MRTIQLTQGLVAIVDDEDFDRINQNKWFARKTNNTWYAVRNPEWPLRGSVYTHREVLGDSAGPKTDHRDGNGLNNQKSNLRPATTRQNAQAKSKLRNGKPAQFRGVTRKRSRWRARIIVNGNEISLGSFETPELAAATYDDAARLYFGEFAACNFPTNQPAQQQEIYETT